MTTPVHYVCGCKAQLGDGTPSLKLPTNRPLVYVQQAPSGYTLDDVWKWLEEAYNRRWGSVCNFQARRIMSLNEATASDYVNHVTVADLGNGGVLADQELPYASGRRLMMRINSRIKWKPTDGAMTGGSIDPVRVVCHEGGHFMGHQHFPTGAPLELMEPVVSNEIISPQPTEARVAAGWFGEPVSIPVPVPPTPPAGTDYDIMTIIRSGVEIYRRRLVPVS
jgi:hypothetical protein